MEYKAAVDAGLATVDTTPDGDAIKVTFKKFDEWTGAEVAPHIMLIDKAVLKQRKKELKAQIVDIDAQLALLA